MTLDTFFDKFELLADAPNAVARMRELILSLAVRGKLVEQDPEDEFGCDLFFRVQQAKLKLISEGVIKKEATLELIAEEEELFEIPNNWTWVRAGELCLPISSGSTPEQSIFKESPGIPYLKVYNIRNQAIDFEYKRQFIDTSYHRDKMKRSTLRPGDIVMNIVGPPLGKVAIIPNDYEEWNCNQAISFFRPIFPEMANYLYLFLREGGFLKNIQLIGTAGQDNISVTKCKFIPIPLPPLAEQKRIVAKVDQLMALCDRLEALQQDRDRRQALIARATLSRFAEAPTLGNLGYLFHPAFSIAPGDLKKAILTLAVSGKLVERIANEGSGTEILAANAIGPLLPINAPALPSHWVWAMLGSVVTRMDSGWSPQCLQEPAPADEWGVLKTTAVQSLEYREDENKALPSSLDPRPKDEVMDGDILITRAGPLNRVGILCVARPSRPKLMISDKIIRFHLIMGIDPNFAALALGSGYSGTIIESLKSGMAASQVNISQPKLKSVPIAIPPLAEQRRIVAKVEQLMALVDALETQQEERDKYASAFANACVASITGSSQIERNQKMKAPKTELISLVTLGNMPKPDDSAPLAQFLIKAKGTLSAKSLWRESGLTIDAFYHQLKAELALGWIAPPAEAEMKMKEEV